MKPYAYFLVVITLSVLRPLTTFIHEMGHAIPSLLYTKGIVTIYVGSYGDPDKSIHFTVGRLKVYFKYNPLLWDSGLCGYNTNGTFDVIMCWCFFFLHWVCKYQ